MGELADQFRRSRLEQADSAEQQQERRRAEDARIAALVEEFLMLARQYRVAPTPAYDHDRQRNSIYRHMRDEIIGYGWTFSLVRKMSESDHSLAVMADKTIVRVFGPPVYARRSSGLFAPRVFQPPERSFGIDETFTYAEFSGSYDVGLDLEHFRGRLLGILE